MGTILGKRKSNVSPSVIVMYDHHDERHQKISSACVFVGQYLVWTTTVTTI